MTARCFYLADRANVVFEQVKGGARAVSPIYNTRAEAERALTFMRANPDYANIQSAAKRGATIPQEQSE